jgi:hypothetical protein
VTQELLVAATEHSAVVEVIKHTAEHLPRHSTRGDANDDERLADGEQRGQPVAGGPRLAERNQTPVQAGLFEQASERRSGLAVEADSAAGPSDRETWSLRPHQRPQLRRREVAGRR